MPWKLGMTMTSKDVLIFNPLKIKESEIIDLICKNSFHIYLICKRKKLYYDSCNTSAVDFNVSIFYTLDDKHNKQFIHKNHRKDLEVVNHSLGKITYKLDGNIFTDDDYLVVNQIFYPEKYFLPRSEVIYTDPIPTDLEVVYIGQSFGRSSKRHIDKRLTNHEKIQEVATRIISEGTNEEVLILGLNYKVVDAGTLMLGSEDFVSDDVSVENLLKLRHKASERMIESQEITLYEAGLIHYFRPHLNTEYTKHKFPALGYSSYDEIYKLNFDYSTAEINTLHNFVRLYSSEVPSRQHVHLNKFALQSEDQKKDFFRFLFE